MNPSELHRRDFAKLAGAALSGLLAGAGLGFAEADDKQPAKKDVTKPLLLQEPHVCRGLNTCKGNGPDKKNDCAGMGACASVKAHTCKTMNECAGQGGCGEKPGENKCKGMGDCHVPLEDKAWVKARANYEAAMKKAEKKFGPAPKKAEK
jgi:hypothetical protein